MKHDSMQINSELGETFTPTSVPAEIGNTNLIPEGFDLPALNGQTTMELQDQISPKYLYACLKMANRAMTGEVNPFKEGDLPHKMALLLAHKMLPSRKIGEKPPLDTPERNKEVSRALKSLIRSLTIDGEVVIDTNKPANASDNGQGQAIKEQQQQRAA